MPRRVALRTLVPMTGELHDDAGACRHCGGRIAATHMLTRTYELDRSGAWRRRLDDFVEDVVVVCAGCGRVPAGRFDARAGRFRFVPVRPIT
jgi:hypothetical protein